MVDGGHPGRTRPDAVRHAWPVLDGLGACAREVAGSYPWYTLTPQDLVRETGVDPDLRRWGGLDPAGGLIPVLGVIPGPMPTPAMTGAIDGLKPSRRAPASRQG